MIAETMDPHWFNGSMLARLHLRPMWACMGISFLNRLPPKDPMERLPEQLVGGIQVARQAQHLRGRRRKRQFADVHQVA